MPSVSNPSKNHIRRLPVALPLGSVAKVVLIRLSYPLDPHTLAGSELIQFINRGSFAAGGGDGDIALFGLKIAEICINGAA